MSDLAIVLTASAVANVVLLVAWLKERGESRDWKSLARTGFEHMTAIAETPREIQNAVTPFIWCRLCSTRAKTVMHPFGTTCPKIVERDVN